MRENCTSGSVRGAPGNRRSYRGDRLLGMLDNKSMAQVTCNNCRTEYEAETNEPSESRTKCPVCGSTARLSFQSCEGGVSVYSKLSYKGKRGGKGKPFVLGVIGYDLFRKIQKWMRLERVIDRENDYYKEVITNPTTGEIIHHCEEPLSEHRGHGSAKKKRTNGAS
jgi:transcription elongation factor Elf1